MGSVSSIKENRLTLSRSILSICKSLSISPIDAAIKLQKIKVNLLSPGTTSIKELQKALSHFQISFGNEPLGLDVVLVNDYLDDRKYLIEINERSLKSDRPWFLLKLGGPQIWIGPFFKTPVTGCFECLLQRLRINQPEKLWQEKMGKTARKKKSLNPSKLSCEFAALEIFKSIVCSQDSLAGKILTLELLEPKLSYHILTKRPQCKCSNKNLQNELKSILLNPCPKIGLKENGYRTCLPEVTFQRFEYHISSITGVISNFKKITDPKCFYPAYIHRNGVCFDIEVDTPLQFKRLRSVGKGKTEIQAKVSCLSEALERYSIIFQGDETCRKCSYLSLKEDAIHPNRYILYSKLQYQNRGKLNAIDSERDQIAYPFDENEEIEWTAFWSLTEKRWKWIPSAYTYLGYPKNRVKTPFCATDTNGCAAGNTIEEAVLQAILELIERDSIAIWWYNQLQRPGVDFFSFQDQTIESMLAKYEGSNRKIWAIDLTFDLQIPVIGVICLETLDDNRIKMTFGCGAHIDAKIALMRALTEAEQYHFIRPVHQIKYFSIETELAWLPNHLEPLKKQTDYIQFQSNDIKEDIEYCQKKIEEKNMEVLVADLTRPDIGMPVVRVIVPGLRHYTNRFAPGRLYDVPYEIGLLERPLTEQQLYSIPFEF